jgi:hypothetical protein
MAAHQANGINLQQHGGPCSVSVPLLLVGISTFRTAGKSRTIRKESRELPANGFSVCSPGLRATVGNTPFFVELRHAGQAFHRLYYFLFAHRTAAASWQKRSAPSPQASQGLF